MGLVFIGGPFSPSANNFFDQTACAEVVFVRFARNDNRIPITFKILFDSYGRLLIRKTVAPGVALFEKFFIARKGYPLKDFSVST
jgi:hypothetical protein